MELLHRHLHKENAVSEFEKGVRDDSDIHGSSDGLQVREELAQVIEAEEEGHRVQRDRQEGVSDANGHIGQEIWICLSSLRKYVRY